MKRFISFAALLILLVNITHVRATGEPAHKLVALTFDDGPHRVYTEELLDGLSERGVPVTFFFLGECAVETPELVRRAYEEGHEIACHTWSHPDLLTLSDEKIQSQLRRCYDLFDEILGEGSDYLVRPPYGSVDKRVRAAVDQVMLSWSVDTLDWKLKDEELVYQNIVSEARDGAIILCHDIHKTTIPAALRAIDTLRLEGYEFVTVSELFRRRGVEPQKGKLYCQCAPGAEDPGPIPEPVISFGTGAEGNITVTIDSEVPVYYTTDGSYPDGRSQRYTGPFTVTDGTEVRAVAAWKLNGSRSGSSTARWVRPTAEVPEPENTDVQPVQSRQGTAPAFAAGVAAGAAARGAADVRRRRRRRRRRSGRTT